MLIATSATHSSVMVFGRCRKQRMVRKTGSGADVIYGDRDLGWTCDLLCTNGHECHYKMSSEM